jgi:hypothetical protein
MDKAGVVGTEYVFVSAVRRDKISWAGASACFFL